MLGGCVKIGAAPKKLQNHPRNDAPELTAEQRRRCFEDLVHRLGDEIND